MELKSRKRIVRVLFTLAAIVTSYNLVTQFLARSVVVESESMQPFYVKGSRVVIVPFAGFGRGDTVCLVPNYHRRDHVLVGILDGLVRFLTFQQLSLGGLFHEPGDRPWMIKRVLAVPGDTVRIENETVTIQTPGNDGFRDEALVSGKRYSVTTSPLPEGWSSAFTASGTPRKLTLQAGEYFVAGDNRSRSSDSRSWGPVKRNDISGRVLLQYWPPDAIGIR